MKEQDSLLLQKILRGDKKAFRKLYDFYELPIYKFISVRVNSKNDAQDIFSVVWEKVINHFKNFKGEFGGSFRSWIFTISRNTIYDYYRSGRHRKNILSLDEAIHLTQDVKFNDHYAQEQLFSCIDRLPKKQAEVVKLKYFQDLKNKEIAHALQQSEKTVASNLSRALRKLARMMQ